MAANGHSLNGWRTDPMYTFSEAAHLANVSASTARNWIFGYSSGNRESMPLLTALANQGPMVSFLQLIEIVVAGRLRNVERAKYHTVYEAHENARRIFGYEYPFAHIEVESIAGHIVGWLRGSAPTGSVQSLDLPSQWTLPGNFLGIREELDYERQLAARWYPVGKAIPIVVDPLFSSGVPTIAGRGVTVGAIHKRFTEGRLPIDFIAQDYEIDRSLVEDAIRFAEQLAA